LEEEEEEDLDILRQILEQVVFPISAKNHRACEFFECKTHLNSAFEVIQKLFRLPQVKSRSVSFWSKILDWSPVDCV
jgi:hypothetical protein